MTSQDRPLTRRELRERERLLEQQAASASQQADAPAPAFPVSPPPQAAPAFPAAPAPSAPAAAPAAPAFASRPAEASTSTEAPVARPAVAAAPTSASESESADAPADPSPFAPRATPQAWSRQEQAVDDDDDDEPTPERTLTRRELRALIDATQLDVDDDDDAIDELDAVAPRGASGAASAPSRTTTPHEPATEATVDPAVAAKPVGHWTSQLDLGEAQPEPFDQLLARGGGGSHGVPTTTSALILPVMPNQGAIGQPLPDGGEILVTGSIDLPRSYGATGMHPSQLESSDVDRLIDHVEDAGGGGAAPVAASRAISTQGHPRDMIAPPKKEGVNAPLVLAVTAGVLALGVVASLVVGAMVGLF